MEKSYKRNFKSKKGYASKRLKIRREKQTNKFLPKIWEVITITGINLPHENHEPM